MIWKGMQINRNRLNGLIDEPNKLTLRRLAGLSTRHDVSKKLRGEAGWLRPDLHLSEYELFCVNQVAKNWSRTINTQLRTRDAIHILLQMGIHHIEQCVNQEPMDMKLAKRDLKAHGIPIKKVWGYDRE